MYGHIQIETDSKRVFRKTKIGEFKQVKNTSFSPENRTDLPLILLYLIIEGFEGFSDLRIEESDRVGRESKVVISEGIIRREELLLASSPFPMLSLSPSSSTEINYYIEKKFQIGPTF